MSFENIFFFFFQAEDGIRDIGVTGVQTCALPIFISADLSHDRKRKPVYPAVETFGEGIFLRFDEERLADWEVVPEVRAREIGRASCRGKSVDLGGRRIIKKKKREVVKSAISSSVS